VATASASISFPLEPRGDEEEEEGEEEEGVVAAIGVPSREGGGSLAISIAESAAAESAATESVESENGNY